MLLFVFVFACGIVVFLFFNCISVLCYLLLMLLYVVFFVVSRFFVVLVLLVFCIVLCCCSLFVSFGFYLFFICFFV